MAKDDYYTIVAKILVFLYKKLNKYDAPLHRSTDERRHAVLQLTQQTDRE